MSGKENANDKMGKWMTGISNMGLAPKKKEGCEFCKGTCEIETGNITVSVFLETRLNIDHTDCSNGDWDEESIKINYCPMCGKRLAND